MKDALSSSLSIKKEKKRDMLVSSRFLKNQASMYVTCQIDKHTILINIIFCSSGNMTSIFYIKKKKNDG